MNHYRWPADHFVLHREHLLARPSLDIVTPLSYCSFTHYIFALHRGSIIRGTFLEHYVVSVEKAVKSSNLHLTALSNRRTNQDLL
jgi:hypothetical protein